MRFILSLFLIVSSALPAYSQEQKRFISLAPSVTEGFILLEAQDSLVGVSAYCALKDTQIVGTLTEPNIEKIVHLRPDAVIGTREGNDLKAFEKIESLGIRVVLLGPDATYTDIKNDFYVLADLVGKKEHAAVVVAAADKKIGKIREGTASLKKPRVFFQLGEEPLVTIGKGSFIHEMIEEAGGENIFADLAQGYSRVDKEEVVKRNPDVIIIIPMTSDSHPCPCVWRKFSTMNAVINNKMFVVASDSFLKPTPESYAFGVEILSGLLHPETLLNKQ